LPLIILAVLSLGFVGSNRAFGLLEKENWFERIVQRPTLEDYSAEASAPGIHREHFESHEEEHRAHAAHQIAVFGSICAFVVGFGLALVIYGMRLLDPARVAKTLQPVHLFLRNKWYMDDLYRFVIIMPYLIVCYVIRLFDNYVIDAAVNLVGLLGRVWSWAVGIVDMGVVDGAVNGTAWSTGFAGRVLRLTQTGQVRNYIFFIIAGATALVLIFLGV